MKFILLPLACPSMISDIRVAAAMTIGITTIAAFIGAGGLGDFITQGLSTSDNKLILLGTIPTALLTLVVDAILALIGILLIKRKREQIKFKRTSIVTIIIIALATIVMVGSHFINNTRKNTVIVASKNFTEQYILGQMIALMIKHHTNLNVETKLNLGTTAIAQNALLKGEIDLYPEYTGTAYLTVLHKKYNPNLSTQALFNTLKQDYQAQFNLTWLPPFGFNNLNSTTKCNALS